MSAWADLGVFCRQECLNSQRRNSSLGPWSRFTDQKSHRLMSSTSDILLTATAIWCSLYSMGKYPTGPAESKVKGQGCFSYCIFISYYQMWWSVKWLYNFIYGDNIELRLIKPKNVLIDNREILIETFTLSDVQERAQRVERHRERWEKRHHRRRRRSISREKWVETLVVADTKMVEYYGKNGVESYVLAVMNIVSIFLFCPLQLFQTWTAFKRLLLL